MKLYDIAFWIVIIACSLRLIWEMIPDPAKKYWSYVRQNRKDHKAGWFDRKWVWSFRNGRKFGGQNDQS